MLIIFLTFGFNAVLILLLLLKVGWPLVKELAPARTRNFLFSPVAIFAIFALFNVNEEIRAAVMKNQMQDQLKIFRVAALVGLYLFLYALLSCGKPLIGLVNFLLLLGLSRPVLGFAFMFLFLYNPVNFF